MKKLFLVAIATVGFAFSGTAQETQFKFGLDAGMPMGDIKDLYSFNISANAAYMWKGIAEGFDVGVGLSYNTYIAKEQDIMGVTVKGDNASFLPIYGTANYSFTENIFAGADLGYGIAMAPSGADSGVYYQPKVGYQAEKFEVFLGYKAIAVSGGAYSSIGLGFNYKL